MTTDPDEFDPERAVNAYRRAIAQLEVATTEFVKDELRITIELLRDEWKRWQGKDSLHEVAFGEPADD